MKKIYCFLLVIFCACSKDKPCYTLKIVSGNEQTGLNNAMLDPFVVKVLDEKGNPKSGIEVLWQSREDMQGGFVKTDDDPFYAASSYSITDQKGEAKTNFKSYKEGTHTFNASIKDLDSDECPAGGTAEFTAYTVDF